MIDSAVFAEEGLPSPVTARVSMGTTLVACKFEGGVVLAADSRTSSFPVVSNKLARKINPVTERIYICRAGSAADTQFVSRLVKKYVAEHAVELGGGPSGRLDGAQRFSPNVRTVANLARLICYNNREALSFAFLVGGVDDLAGPQLFGVMAGGTLFERDFFATGSGSTYIAALIDSTYKPQMDRAAAVQWATSLVNHAIMRDNASGGVVRYVVIDAAGATEGTIAGADLAKLELSSRV